MGRVGVLLLNLGGPEKLEDVKPFLFNLFSDPEIIRLPVPAFQKPLAWFISTLRAKKSQDNYKEIGGGSPLLQITQDQANALRHNFRTKDEDIEDIKVYIGMRYWNPFTEEAIAQIKRDRINKLVVLPLYPHFSISTSGSSFRVIEKMWDEDTELRQIDYTLIPSWHDHPTYIDSIAKLIAGELQQCPNPEQVHIFFSAHGVPQSYVDEAGDPYQEHIEQCTRLIMQKLNHSNDHTLAYQSKVGPVEWLKPYTDEALIDLGTKGVKDVLMVPISFVSEHIETLQEIDIEYREVAEEAGITNFNRVPAPNTDERFIQALTELVEESLNSPPCTFDRVQHPKKNMKMYPQERWQWGLTPIAEVWNGRFAMLGFLALLAEMVSGRGPLHFVGLM